MMLVGKFYRIPHVLMADTQRRPFMIWVPILLPLHEDIEFIGVPGNHWHLDFRFWTDQLKTHYAPMRTALVAWEKDVRDGPEIKLRKCRRPMPPCVGPKFQARETIPWIGVLEAAYVKCTLKAGQICPHRGVDLSGMPDVVGMPGIVECPAHALRWNRTTVAIVRTPSLQKDDLPC